MLRTLLALGLTAIMFAGSGCRLPCHPYDYCGPVYQGPECSSRASQARAGSILADMPQPQTPSPAPIQRQTPPSRNSAWFPARSESFR